MSSPAALPPRPAQDWGIPLTRLDAVWSGLEQLLAVWVILAEIAVLIAWVSLKGLASTTSDTNLIGLIFRSAVTAMLLGGVTFLVTRKQKLSSAMVSAAVILGLFLGRIWVEVGVAWSSNAVEWLQSSSSLALIGGPRGLVTRLTLWIALLGAALAASRGKHINVDVLTRFLPGRAVLPVTILGSFAAAIVCFAAAYGFVDSIAVTKYRAEAFGPCPGGGAAICDTKFSDRVGKIFEGANHDFFLLRRQIGLDLSTFPKVLAGEPYDSWLDAPTWNGLVKESGWDAHFSKEAVHSLLLPTDDPTTRKRPMVVAPDTGEGVGLLIRDLNFILPFGLLVIGLKFLLRILLLLSGHVLIESDAAHGDAEIHPHEAAKS